MHVASKELCQELYELSGWYDTFAWYSGDAIKFEGEAGYEGSVCENAIQYDWCTDIPAYELGYLMRKLQPFQYKVKGRHSDVMPVRCLPFVWQESTHEWRAGYKYNLLGQRYDDLFIYASSPEDAACKLAIELLKQGILAKENQDNE